MKKFVLFILAVLISGSLFANEAAIRKIMNEINSCIGNMQFEKIIPYTAADYTGITAKGQTISYAQISQIPVLFALCGNPDSKLSEVAAAAAVIAGKTMPEQQLELLRSIDDTPEGKTLAENIKTTFKNEMNARKTTFRQIADSFNIVSVNVDGDKAIAVYTNFDPESKRNKETTVNFVKRNGKWLMVREVTKYI